MIWNEILILFIIAMGLFTIDMLVAEAFCEAVKGFENHFEAIEFAVYSPRENNANYDTFKNVIKNRSDI